MTEFKYHIRIFLCIGSSLGIALSNCGFFTCNGNERASLTDSLSKEITVIKERIARRAAHFNWVLHTELLKLYVRSGMHDSALAECNEILLNKPFDETMIAFLSDGNPATNKQQVIAHLIDTAQTHTWLTCVVAQCYLTVAELYLRGGDKEQAKKFYDLVLKDAFAGTQQYYAEARISKLQLVTGSNPLDPVPRIEICLSLIANKPDVMAFETRNSLRELYQIIGKDAESMSICNQLLNFKPNDEYLVNVLSKWQLYRDNKQALANLMQHARTYNNLPCVRNACLLAAADLYVTAKQKTSAEKVYAAIIQDKSANAAPYRIVAQVSLNLLHDAL